MAKTTKTLEERIRALQDINEILNLKARYLRACDGGWAGPSHDADAVALTFTADARWQAEGFPLVEGREAIREAFRTFRVQAPFAFHCITNPFIETDGDSAVGEWHLVETFTDAAGSHVYAGGRYLDRFARVQGRWLIRSLTLTYAFKRCSRP